MYDAIVQRDDEIFEIPERRAYMYREIIHIYDKCMINP